MSLIICTLGDFCLIPNGQELPPTAWKNQKNRLLCQLLLTRRSAPPHREQVMEWLWPHLPPAKADRSLRVAVSQLRRTLEPDLPPRADSAFVLTTPSGYAWNLQADYCLDADRFDRLCGDLAASPNTTTPHTRLTLGEEAKALYRGDYLAAEPYADWATAERERLREQYFALLTRLADAYAHMGRYQRAVVLCREVLAADRCRESVWRQLMLYHYHAGDQARALQVYDECAAALGQEIGVSPLPETERIRQQIENRAVGSEEAAVRYPTPAILERARHVPLSWARLPFVGREAELAQLLAPQRDPGRVLLIEGEAGAGKSRLAEEAVRLWQQQGSRTLCEQVVVEGALPLQPLLGALNAALHETPASPETISPDAQQILGDLLPQLQQAEPRTPPLAALAQRAARTRLFDALAGLLLALRGTRPQLILFFDDIQWADPATLEFLTHLLPRLPQEPFLLLLTLRGEETHSPALAEFLAACQRHRLLQRVEVERLSPEACIDLCRELSGMDETGALLGHWLHRESDGNPLFLLSQLQSLFEDGLLRVDSQGEWQTPAPDFFREARGTTPSTVLQVIHRRLARLDQAERQVLEAAAVLGPLFQRRLLAEMRGWHPHRLFDQLDRLVQGMLLHEETGDRYRFGHDKIHQAVYDAIPAQRRAWLHSRAGRAIEAVAGHDPARWAAPLAHHFDQAGESETAFRWRLAAGWQSFQVYDNRGALAHFERALALAESGAFNPAAADRLLVRERLGDLHAAAGRYSEALEQFTQAQAECWEAEDRVRLRYKMASGYDRLGQWGPSRRLMAEAVAEVERLGAAAVGPLEAARALARWSILGMPDRAASEQYARRAESLVAPWLPPKPETTHRLPWKEFDIVHGVLINGGEAFRHWARWAEAEDLFERSLHLAEAQNDPSAIGYSSNNLGDVRLALGDFIGAQLLHSRAATAWAQAGERWLEMAARTHLGLAHACPGDWPSALGHLQAALRLGESIEPTEWLASVHLCLVLAHVKNGAETARATAHLIQSERIAANLDKPLSFFLHALAQAVLAQQRGDDATPHLAKAQAALANGGDIYGRWLLPHFSSI